MGENSFPGSDITYTPPTQATNIVNLGCLNSSAITDIVPIFQSWPHSQSPYEYATKSSASVFSSSVYLNSDVSLYQSANGVIGNNYSAISLSQEGLLWTLWPLVKTDFATHPEITYFDEIYFGTAKKSKYPLGQLGFFMNNKIVGCTPFGAVNPNNNTTVEMIPGLESLNQALLTITEQQVATIVVKVSEQIARIENPESGMAADDEYIFVGYDAWAVIHTSANPVGPLMMSTYITPQTITGSIVGNNYQIILPPNFPNVIFYKNGTYTIPNTTDFGLSTN